MSCEEVLEAVQQYPCRLVEITGGEPLMQEESLPLMTSLCDRGYDVLLETGGSLDIAKVDPRVKRIVDLKCPGSGMAKKNRWSNIAELRPGDELKFVIGDREDFEWAAARVRQYGLDRKATVLFSPVFGTLPPGTLAGWILAAGVPVRMQIQLHKALWDPSRRGV